MLICCRVNPVFRSEKRSTRHRSDSVWFGSYFRFTNRNCNQNHYHKHSNNHRPTRTTRTARAARTTRTSRNTHGNYNHSSKGSQEQQEDHNCLLFWGEMLPMSCQTTGRNSKMQNPTSMFQNIANTAQNEKPNAKNSDTKKTTIVCYCGGEMLQMSCQTTG